MRIEALHVKNYKVLRDLEMKDIPPLCVVIGANGTGKTTLFDVFGFLKDCLDKNVTRALMSRGGFKEVCSRETDMRSISFEVKFRMPIGNKDRLVTYLLVLKEERGKPYIEREVLRYKRGRHGHPYHFLDFSRGLGFAITNEEESTKKDEELDREDQQLGSEDVLAIKGLGQFSRFKAASAFRQLIENWHVSDFFINSARGAKHPIGNDDHLSETGDNLQLVARNIHDHHPEIYEKIVTAMKHRVPGIDGVETRTTEDGRLLLGFRDGSFKDPFVDRFVSDGTIKMFAYLILLYAPVGHPVLCVEEPENQLYVNLLGELAEEFRSYANRGGQVFVSTHSPDFLNAIDISEVFWLVKEQGRTRAMRASDDDQLQALINEGDKMGYLWKQGLFDNIDPK